MSENGEPGALSHRQGKPDCAPPPCFAWSPPRSGEDRQRPLTTPFSAIPARPAPITGNPHQRPSRENPPMPLEPEANKGIVGWTERTAQTERSHSHGQEREEHDDDAYAPQHR